MTPLSIKFGAIGQISTAPTFRLSRIGISWCWTRLSILCVYIGRRLLTPKLLAIVLKTRTGILPMDIVHRNWPLAAIGPDGRTQNLVLQLFVRPAMTSHLTHGVLPLVLVQELAGNVPTVDKAPLQLVRYPYRTGRFL